MSIKCFFGIHAYKPIAVRHYNDISYSRNGSPSTAVTYRCQRCNKIRTEGLYGAGYLTMQQITGNPE